MASLTFDFNFEDVYFALKNITNDAPKMINSFLTLQLTSVLSRKLWSPCRPLTVVNEILQSSAAPGSPPSPLRPHSGGNQSCTNNDEWTSLMLFICLPFPCNLGKWGVNSKRENVVYFCTSVSESHPTGLHNIRRHSVGALFIQTTDLPQRALSQSPVRQEASSWHSRPN